MNGKRVALLLAQFALILNLRRRVRKLEAGPGAARKLRDVVAGPDVRERAPENSVLLRFRVAA